MTYIVDLLSIVNKKRSSLVFNQAYELGLWCFKATFNNISVISWWSVLLMEHTGVLVENHRPAVSH
jgi:hypothetical protein